MNLLIWELDVPCKELGPEEQGGMLFPGDMASVKKWITDALACNAIEGGGRCLNGREITVDYVHELRIYEILPTPHHVAAEIEIKVEIN